jgi:hypothetical protein
MVPIPVVSYLNSAPCRFGVVRGDQYVAAVSTSNSEAMPSAMLVSTERLGRAAKNSSLSAPRARQSAAGKKKRAASFGMTRIYELAAGAGDR